MSSVATETIVPVSDPTALMNLFVHHIAEEHGVEFDHKPSGGRSLNAEGFTIEFDPTPQGLAIRIAGPHESVLIFMKEEVVGHVAEIDATAAANIRWSGETAEVGALPRNFKVLDVIGGREIFPGLLRVTLSHENVATLTVGGIHLRLMMPLLRDRMPVWPRMAENGVPVWPQGDDKLHARFITLRHVRDEANEVDIDIAAHDGGLISDWARQATPGQSVGVMGPAGEANLPTTDGLFLAGDATGLAAVARLMETAGAQATGDVVLAAPEDYDPSEYLPPSPLTVHAIAPERFEAEVVGRARELTAAGKTGYAFFAGEFQNAQDLRAHFKQDLGLDKETQLSTAYWRRGVPGHGS